MLKEDAQKLKQIIKSMRRDRRFQTQFANQMNNKGPYSQSCHPYSQQQNIKSIHQRFGDRFPKLTYLCESSPCQYSYCSIINSFTINNTAKSEVQEDNEQINKEDEQIWRNYYQNNKNLPIVQPNQEIIRICQCLKQLNKQITMLNLYDRLYDSYKGRGGLKAYDQFKQKIQRDVMFLVKKQKMKGK